MTVQQPPADERELLAQRLVAFPRAAVLEAFTDPARLARWWGPKGFTNRFATCEPRPGGAWRFTMVGPNGAEYPNESRFAELGPEQVVIEHLSAPAFTLTVRFTDHANGAWISWRQRFESVQLREQVERIAGPGNEENLDRLEAELARAGD